MQEIWKDVVGYEGLYQVSNMGRVKRIPHPFEHRGFIQMRSEKIIKPTPINYGEHRPQRWKVNLYKNKVMKTLRVHRLVAEAFIPNPLNKETVNHIDGNPKNNCVDNLEWATLKENSDHAYRTGLKKKPDFGTKSNNCVLTLEDLKYIKENYIRHKAGHCNIDIAKELSKRNGKRITRGCVGDVTRRKTYVKEYASI